jgi:hypothetical protein
MDDCSICEWIETGLLPAFRTVNQDQIQPGIPEKQVI